MKKIKASELEGEDTTWQAIYMDLITMLMIVFLILATRVSQGLDQGKSSGKGLAFESLKIGDNSFVTGKATLTEDAKMRIMDNLADINNPQNSFLKELGFDKENEKYYFLTIHGHTDSLGSDQNNINLAFDRANNVRSLLVNKFIELRKSGNTIRHSELDKRVLVSVCAHGHNFPTSRDTVEPQRGLGLPENRRVNITSHIVNEDELKRLIGAENTDN